MFGSDLIGKMHVDHLVSLALVKEAQFGTFFTESGNAQKYFMVDPVLLRVMQTKEFCNGDTTNVNIKVF